ncbi:MAG: TonB family protein [Arcobacteraceae bacterium]|jgi:protein TonB|nr:TonB family protein [Arcobacteraceae bacterium]
MAIFKDKAYVISFLIHSLVFFVYLFLINTKIEPTLKEQSISFEISLAQFQEEISPVKSEVVKQEVIKPIEPEVVKPIVEKPAIVKPIAKPIKEAVKEPVTKPIEPVVEQLVEPITQPSIKEQEPIVSNTTQTPAEEIVVSKEVVAKDFVETNFTVIRDMVLKNLVYPKSAQRMNQTGVVELTLVIDPQGKLIEYFVSKNSNFKALDKAALQSVEKTANALFPKPQTTSTIVLPVSFRLN